MNQSSFSNYIKEVYNPGSPNPNPKVSPLRSLPKDCISPFNSAKIDPKNPLKIVFGSKRKNPDSDSESDSESLHSSQPSPKKKLKMMKEEDVKAFMKEFRESKTESSKVLETMAAMNAKLDNLAESQTNAALTAAKDKESSDARIKALEDKFEEFQNNTQSVIKSDQYIIEEAVKNYVDNSTDDTWKANLAREVFEHEHGVIVHGVRFDFSNENTKVEAVRKFLKESLKASEELVKKIRVKEVVRLGGDNGAGKPPPILIKFGHPTERNQVLPLSVNLPRGIDMDKNIPKKYLKKHKEFKRLAWKLKTVHGVQTQVIFDEYNLILRYKKKDEGVSKFNYITEKEWFPKPGEIENSKTKGVANDPNKLDTPAIDTSSLADCHKTIIVTGLPDSINHTNASTELYQTYFESKDHTHLIKIDYKSKGTVVILCKNWNACNILAKAYEGIKFQNNILTFHMFSETDPEAA